MVSPAPATSKSTPPIRQVLGVSLAGQNILVELDCDETQKNVDGTPLLVACDWFLVKDGQTRPPSGLFNQPIRLPDGRILRAASTCIS